MDTQAWRASNSRLLQRLETTRFAFVNAAAVRTWASDKVLRFGRWMSGVGIVVFEVAHSASVLCEGLYGVTTIHKYCDRIRLRRVSSNCSSIHAMLQVPKERYGPTLRWKVQSGCYERSTSQLLSFCQHSTFIYSKVIGPFAQTAVSLEEAAVAQR